MSTQVHNDAWQDGYATRGHGNGLAFNPHPHATSPWYSWETGWRAAHQVLGTGDQMFSQQLEDQADEARDEAAERTEGLDQREADLAGLVTDLENEVGTLTSQLDAACAKRRTQGEIIGQRNRMLHELRCKLQVEVGSNRVLRRQLDAATELVNKVGDERDALREQLARENVDVTKEVCRAECAEREAKRLREVIAVAIERTQNMVLYCGSTLALLRAPDTAIEIERGTHGTDTGM